MPRMNRLLQPWSLHWEIWIWTICPHSAPEWRRWRGYSYLEKVLSTTWICVVWPLWKKMGNWSPILRYASFAEGIPEMYWEQCTRQDKLLYAERKTYIWRSSCVFSSWKDNIETCLCTFRGCSTRNDTAVIDQSFQTQSTAAIWC